MHTPTPRGSCPPLAPCPPLASRPAPAVGGPRSLRLRPLSVFLGVLFGVLALLSAGVRPASAASFLVTTLADGTSPVPAGSLRAAITSANAANANGGSTITFAAGLSGTITLTSALPALTKSMTITGPGASVIFVDGAGTYQPFYVNSEVTANLSGLTIQNGHGSDSTAFDGGGIYNGGTLTLTACTLTQNRAGDSGGGVYNGGTATLTGCTLIGNRATNGGGVYNGGTATLTGCTLTGNSGAYGEGGGVYNGGTLTLTGCTLAGNSAFDGGGVFNLGTATLTLTGCTLTQNSASHTGEGGGVENEGTLTLTACTLTQNSADESGGGVYNSGTATLTLTGCTLAGNSASYGGGISNSGTLTLTACTLAGNSTNQGGGGVFNGGTATLTDAILYGDTAPSGNEIDNFGSVSATYCDIQQGGYAGGGNFDADPLFVSSAAPFDLHLKAGSPCIHVGNPQLAGTPDHDGNLYAAPNPSLGAYEYEFYIVTNTNDSGNGSLRAAITYANGHGGTAITFTTGLSGTILLRSVLPALGKSMTITGPGASVIFVDGAGTYRPFVISAEVTLSGLTIQNGNAHLGNGGGVYNTGTVTLTACTLTQNSGFFGGGIYNGGALTLSGCTLTQNSTANSGGGIYSAGTLTLTACTLAGNIADFGGGVYSYNSALTLTGCTLTQNSAADYGGGIYNNGGTGTLTDVILYGDIAPSGNEIDNFGSATAAYCDIQQSGFAGSGGNLSADPRLAPLGSYGGPTQTCALLPGSPCLGAGTNAGLTADQRGVAIPQNGRYDIGAFESQGFTVSGGSGSGGTGGSGQSAPVSTAFAQSLTATVTANAFSEPVAGGVLTFTCPLSGASAAFSPDPAPIGSTGGAGVTATANGTPGGPYPVIADTGAGSAVYLLSNAKAVTSVGLTSSLNPSGFGQSVTFTATLSGGVSPTGSVTFTVDGVAGTPVALSGASAAFTTSALSAGPHTVVAAYSGDANNATGTSGALTQTVNPAVAQDVSGQVTVTRGGYFFNRQRNLLQQVLTLINTGPALLGPVVVAFDGLPQGVAVFRPDGYTQAALPSGSPYLVVVAAGGALASGGSVSVPVSFYDPAHVPVPYSPRVLAGAGD